MAYLPAASRRAWEQLPVRSQPSWLTVREAEGVTQPGRCLRGFKQQNRLSHSPGGQKSELGMLAGGPPEERPQEKAARRHDLRP